MERRVNWAGRAQVAPDQDELLADVVREPPECAARAGANGPLHDLRLAGAPAFRTPKSQMWPEAPRLECDSLSLKRGRQPRMERFHRAPRRFVDAGPDHAERAR